MRSTDKAILFLKSTHDKSTRVDPVAVFNKGSEAKSYAAHLHSAITAGNVDAVKNLFPGYPFTPDGKLRTTHKFSVPVVAYQPDPSGSLPEAEFE